MKRNLMETMAWMNVAAMAILLGATVFQMMVIVPEYHRDLPRGMVAFAASGVMPANFWASPLVRWLEIVPLLAMVLHWKTPRRNWLLIGTVCFVAGAAATVLYFYPRMAAMGLTTGGRHAADLAVLATAVREWIVADQIRFWLAIVPAFLLSLKALTVPLGREA